MSNSWRQAYTDLKAFIAEHPEVEIKVNVVRIQENVRTEFYRLFDMVRVAFVDEKFPSLLDEAKSLSESYSKTELEVIEHVGLDGISMAADLREFLHNPKDRAIRELFNPLFDLLKGKVDTEIFEQKASRNAETTLRNLYRIGYEKWVMLSLVQLLESDKSFQVTLRQLDPREINRRTPTSKEPVPPLKESKRLSFEHEPYSILTVPDFIVHSARVNKYVAIRSEFREAMWTASDASENREWYPLDSITTLELEDLILIYIAETPEEISLVADKERICRPDLIIECRGQNEWYEKEGLEEVKLHHGSLKPKLGTYVVSREPVPEQAYEELMPKHVSKESKKTSEGLTPEVALTEHTLEQVSEEPMPELKPEEQQKIINIFTVGFDKSKLEPIVSRLMHPKSED